MKVDSRGRFYISDEAANHVYQLSRAGKVLRTFGRLDAQKPGAYDPLALMAPGKLATWTDPEGHDRLLIVENAGPNRVAEWSDDGQLLREFLTLQTKANDGYGVDPEHPEDIYLPGQRNWLTRFHVDYEKRTWTVNSVWPLVDDPRARGLKKPKLIRANGRTVSRRRERHTRRVLSTSTVSTTMAGNSPPPSSAKRPARNHHPTISSGTTPTAMAAWTTTN